MKKFEVEEVLDDEVWSWRCFKLTKFEIEELWSWRKLKLKKFEVEEICVWRSLKLKFGAFFPFLGFIVIFGGCG